MCQLRLDFNQFMIAGPSTSTVSIGGTINGDLVASGGASATTASQCLTDTFSVSNPGGGTRKSIISYAKTCITLDGSFSSSHHLWH